MQSSESERRHESAWRKSHASSQIQLDAQAHFDAALIVRVGHDFVEKGCMEHWRANDERQALALEGNKQAKKGRKARDEGARRCERLVLTRAMLSACRWLVLDGAQYLP